MYDAFISYSQAADADIVAAIQRGLERIGKPWHQRRALRVFRDQTSLTANPGLWSSISNTLDQSAWLILVASPAAADSRWVNQELDHWLSTKSPDRILCVLSSGTWQWDSQAADFTEESTAVPSALRGVLGDEPRYVDLRWTQGQVNFNLQDVRFHNAVAEIAAAVRGLAKDDVVGEDLRQHRRTRRLVSAVIVGLALLTTAAIAAATFAINEKDQANRERRSAESRALASSSLARAATDVHEALLLAAAANRISNTVESRRALLSSLNADPALSRVVTFRDADVIGVSRDRTLLATVRSDGTARVWSVSTGRPVTPWIAAYKHPAVLVTISPDNSTLLVGSGGLLKIFDIPTGASRGVLDKPRGRVEAAAFSPDGLLLAVAAEPPRPQVLLLNGRASTLLRFRTSDWSRLGEPIFCYGPPLTSRSLDFTPDSAAIALACDKELHFFDATSGAATTTIPIPSLYATHVTVSPDGRLAALTGSDEPFADNPDTRVQLVDLQRAQPRGGPLDVRGRVDPSLLSPLVTSAAFNGDGTRLVTSGADGDVTVWNTDTLQRTWGAPHLSEPVELAWFSGNHRIQAGSSHRILTWSLAQRANNAVQAAALSGTLGGTQLAMVDTHTVAIGMADGSILFRDLRTGKETSPSLSTATSPSLDISVSSDKRHLIQSFGGLTVDSKDQLLNPDDLVTRPTGVAEHVLWNLISRSSRAVDPLPVTATVTFAIGPNTSGVDASGRALVLKPGVGVVAIDPRDLTHTSVVRDPLAYSFVEHDNSLIATAGPNTVSIWHPGQRTPRFRLRLRGLISVNDLAISTDGRNLAVAFSVSRSGGRVMVISTERGRPIGPVITLRNSKPTSVALSGNGHVLAVGDSVGQTRVWDLASSEPLSPPLGRPRLGVSVADIRFGDNDRTIATLLGGTDAREDKTFQEARRDWLIFRRIDAPTLRKMACTIARPGFAPDDWRNLTGSETHNGSCS